MSQFQTVLISEQLELLSAIKFLGRANSGTLGFLPEGAFDERAASNQIVAAINLDGKLVGYLLYRVARGRAVIVHLCVDEKHRGANIGQQLVARLRKQVSSLDGIRLKCRRDYSASKLWPQCGFKYISETLGRGQDGETLTVWGEDFASHQSLFTSLNDPELYPPLQAVLDMNIFLDLTDATRKDHAESQGLRADWLQDEISLWLTHEVATEINRNSDQRARTARMAAASKFLELNVPFDTWEPIRKRLFETGMFSESTSDESDLRHLSIAIGGRARYFVTRDGKLLTLQEQIERDFGIRIIRPSNLIIQLDSLLNEPTYAPGRLAGCLISKRPFQEGEEETLISRFLSKRGEERKPDFLTTLRTALANPAKCSVNIFEDTAGPLAIVVTRQESKTLQSVQFLRMWPNHLGATLGHSILLDLTTSTTVRASNVIHVKDRHISQEFLPGLTELGFFPYSGLWAKYAVHEIGTAVQIADTMSGFSELEQQVGEIATRVAGELRDHSPDLQHKDKMLRIEKSLWPAKIWDLKLPCFVIPIRPLWAAHLFDKNLAAQHLFGVDPKLAMNGENVYYRSPNASLGLKAPGRVLWYVCGDDLYSGAGAIRACSYVDEVIIDKPKAIYARFKRLGVYEWKDVFDIAGNNQDGEVMAIRFSATELLDQPISLSKYREVFGEETGKQPQLQSPFPISEKCFYKLYSLGLSSHQSRNASTQNTHGD